jgi:hypothetical protein
MTAPPVKTVIIEINNMKNPAQLLTTTSFAIRTKNQLFGVIEEKTTGMIVVID